MATLTFEGGLNEQDISLVDQSECTAGYNFELGSRNTHLQPRKPFDLKGTATNASPINGFIQLEKQDDTVSTLVQAGSTVYEWDGASTFTSKGSVSSSARLRGTSWTLGDYAVITDITKNELMKKWDGTSLTTLTTGLSPSTLYAKYSVIHLGRMWLFNVKTSTDTPHLLVASEFENPESYDTAKRAKDATFSTGNEAFYMTMPDLKPINGVSLFMGILIVSTENGRLWKITGTDSQDFAILPFYAGSAAIGTESIANIGDDIVYMKKDGVIESLRSSDAFGDVKTDDLSRWISNSTAGLSDSITVYDQSKQKVYFFSGTNKLCVLFKEMLGTNLSPWSVYKTDHASSFSTNAAIYMRNPTNSNHFVYFGDDSGNIYILEGEATGDPSSTTVTTYRKSKFFEEVETKKGVLDPRKDIYRGRVYYKRVSDVDLIMDFEFADDYAVNRCTVPLDGPGIADSGGYFGGSSYFGGAFYFNSGFEFSQRTSTKGYSPVGRGPGVFLELTVTDLQTFDVMKIEV